MELLYFFIAIFLIIILLFYIFAGWRWETKILDWVLSGRKKRGLETESLRKLKEGKASFASVTEGRKDRKNRKLIRIVISHLALYLFIFGFFTYFIFGWRARYISPTTRHIIILVMVVILFPLVSIFYELERRKIKRKKKTDIQNKKEI